MSRQAFAESVGLELRAMREELGLTQEQVADAVGVSRAAIATWERGGSTLSAYSHQRLKQFFRTQRRSQVPAGEVAS